MLIFCHGLESSPNGNKASWLKEHYDGLTPTLKTQETRHFYSGPDNKSRIEHQEGVRQELRLNARNVASTLAMARNYLSARLTVVRSCAK